MNLLNSVVIEGRAVSVTPLTKGVTSILLVYTRKFSTPDSGVAGDVAITVRTAIKGIADRLKEGDGLRLVGKIVTVNGGIGLWAEHLEVKPAPRRDTSV